jgi:hypothetical protein
MNKTRDSESYFHVPCMLFLVSAVKSITKAGKGVPVQERERSGTAAGAFPEPRGALAEG